MTILDRINARLLITEQGCWEFQGYRLPSGYGRVGWDGRLWLVHRVMYTLMVGPIPGDLEIDHLCKNKPCCNPAHLEAVTRSENIRRGTQWQHVVARNAAVTHCPEGHPYSAENTYRTARCGRQCRICKHEAGIRYAERKRALLAEKARSRRARQREMAA